MREFPIAKTVFALGLAACLAGGAYAETIDFENPAYATDKTVVGSDGWLQASTDPVTAQDNFKIQAGTLGEGRWLHARTAGLATVYRPLGNALGNAQLIDVRWRWRGLSDSAHLCVGVAGSAGAVRQADRALACLEPGGTLSAQGGSLVAAPTAETWRKGAWLYMRMVLDNTAGTTGRFTLYVADDSLRAVERIALPAALMGGSGAAARIAIRGEDGTGYADVDDFSWEAIAQWQPAADGDTAWSSGKNWSTGAPPDSDARVLFPDGGLRGCLLDRDATVRSVTMASGFKGTFNLGARTLGVLGNGDFTGGATASGSGQIRFPSAHSSSLMGSQANRALPVIRHDGKGVLRLDGRALLAAGLIQSAGAFDFNGFDLMLAGAWVVQAGGPGTLRNLDGRSIIAVQGVRLEGSAPDTLLGLATSPRGWTLNQSGTDSLTARYALLGNARSTGNPGFAYLSADAGGTAGWTFFNVPAFALQPRDTTLRPGETAVLRVSLAAKAGATYQWLRNDIEIPGARDSILTLASLRKSDSGAVFSCKASNPAGYAFSRAATVKVAFPAPTSLPAPRTFTDSQDVQLVPPLASARIYYSLNGGPWQAYVAALSLRDSTVVRAYAVLAGDTSATAVLSFPKASLPQLAAPSILPDVPGFAESLVVSLSHPVAGARLYYTLNGDDPNEASTPYQAPFTLKATATVRAIAYLEGSRPSPVRSRIYARQGGEALPSPTADPSGGAFTDSVFVRLTPPPGYPDADIYWVLEPPAPGDAGGPAKYDGAVAIHRTCILKALAVAGSRASDTVRWAFRRNLGPPLVSPKGRIFPDTLRVRASGASGDSGAVVRYTLDGSDPGPTSTLFPSQGILLDSSSDLKVMALRAGETGPIAAEAYTLIPDTPSAAPHGGDYSSPIRIVLASSAPRASVYYTLDGSTPGPENGSAPYAGPIDLAANATLKAVAVAGTGAQARRGPIRIENYAFIAPGKRVLGPGQRLQLSGNYSLTSVYAGASPVDVEIIAANTVSEGLKGFRDILFGIRLSLPDGAGAFPKVAFNAPAGEPRALFQLVSAGMARWVSARDTTSLDAPGTYFLAVDTAAPILRYAGETFTGEDSTRLVVTIEDNVQNLSLDLERSDDPAGSFAGREVSPILVLGVNAKNPRGDLKPLTIKLRVSDHTLATAFPPDGSAYPLAQKFGDGAHSPAAYHIGGDAQAPWDMVSVPLATEKPLTVSQLRKNNGVPALQGSVLDSSTGKYRFLAPEEPIPSGRSVWLAAPTSLTSLAFPALQTAPRRGKATSRLTLHPGWNQVADPGLAPLWWPVSRANAEIYRASQLKGLHTWDAIAGGYTHAESLEPWRGYFAYYYGGRDTIVTLLEEAPVPPAAKTATAAPGQSGAGLGVGLRMSWPDGSDLMLGAAMGAQDGFGLEDEARPPSPGTGGTRLYSDRAGARLETDIVGWRPGSIYVWKVVAGLSRRASGPSIQAGANPSAATSGTAAAPAPDALTAFCESLPPGYSAWAVSHSRGLRFPLSGDATRTAMPWHPGYTDTLEVLAGPAAELESRFGRIPLRPGPFSARAIPSPGGYVLRLDLPAAGRFRLTLFSLDGRAAEDRSLDLPAGRYRLESMGRLAPGLYALRLLASGLAADAGEGAGIPTHTSLKLAIP
jgi:hypothetical protein